MVAFPDGASDELLQFEEGGLGAEQAGHGGHTDLGRLGGVEDQRHDGRQELVAVNGGNRLQGEDDLRADSGGDGSGLGVRDQALDGRDQVGVAKGHQSHNHLGVGLGRLEGFVGHAGVLVDGVGLARAQFVGRAGDADQVAESQSDGTSQFPSFKKTNSFL